MSLVPRVLRASAFALLTWTTLLACLSAAMTAASAADLSVQQVFDQNGNPVVSASLNPDPGGPSPTWEVCEPACRPATSGPVLENGPTSPGTTFRASVEREGQRFERTTDAWQGQVQATAPPTIHGPQNVGAVVRPMAGTWGGGWPDDYSLLGLVACEDDQARRCRTLIDYRFGPKTAVRVPSWSAGRYLFATAARFPADAAFPLIGYSSPGAVPPPVPAQTVAFSKPLGRVAGPRPPRVRLRRNTKVSGGQIVIGRVAYPGPFEVQVLASTATLGIRSTISKRHGGTLAIPYRKPLGRHVAVTVSIDDGPPVTGRLTVRRQRTSSRRTN